MRLIDAEAFYKAVEKEKKMLLKNGKTSDSSILVGGLQMVLEWINEQPTIEAKPVVHAHWEYIGESDGKKIYRCTSCKSNICGTGNYCKECGAKMDESISCSHEDDKPISQTHENGVKIPVISMEDVPKIMEESD